MNVFNSRFNDYFNSADLTAWFSSDKKLEEQIEDNVQLFSYGEMNYQSFEGKYSSENYRKRKVIAIPHALLSGVIKPIYHLAQAIPLIPQLIFGKRNQSVVPIYRVARDMEESSGWIVTLFHDKLGSYIVQESRFQQQCYSYFYFDNHFTPHEALIQGSWYLRPQDWVQNGPNRFTDVKQITETIGFPLSKHYTKKDLKKIDEHADDFSKLEVPDLETCYKYWGIADWLDNPSLLSRIDQFLSDYYQFKPFSIPKEIIELPIDSEEAKKSYFLALSEDTKDLLLWVREPEQGQLPLTRATCEKKIGVWLKEIKDNNELFIAKCRWLAMKGFFLESLDLESCRLTIDCLNQCLAFQHKIRDLNLKGVKQVQGTIDFSKIKQLQSLNLSNSDIYNESILPLAQLKELRSLNVSLCFPNQDALGEILSKMKKLTHLELVGNKLTDGMGLYLLPLKNLTYLNLRLNKFTDVIGRDLSSLKKLTQLDLSTNEFTDKMGPYLSQLSELTFLSLSRNKFTDTIIPSLCLLENLEKLHLSNTEGITNEITSLLNVSKKLKILNFAVCTKLTNAIGPSLLQQIHLESLSLDNIKNITDDIMQYIVKLERLNHLGLSKCKVTPAIGSFLIQMKNLKSVSLRGMNMVEWDNDTMRTLKGRGCRIITE